MPRSRLPAIIIGIILMMSFTGVAQGLEQDATNGPDVAKRNLIRIAAGITDIGMKRAREMLELSWTQNVTEAEVADEIRRAMTDNGSNPYVEAFPPIVASGNDSAQPHGNPDNDDTNQILPGEAVVVDIGARYKGWCADETRTFYIGSQAPDEFVEVYNIVKEAHDISAKELRVGTLAGEVDKVAREYIASQGYGENFTHCLGHGLGIRVHQPPMLCPGNMEPLMAWSDQVVTIEPGIYLEGNFGVRIEDDYAILRAGSEQYTHSSDDLDFVLIKPPANYSIEGPEMTKGPSGTSVDAPLLIGIAVIAAICIIFALSRDLRRRVLQLVKR